jgi:hypothetical protein
LIQKTSANQKASEKNNKKSPKPLTKIISQEGKEHGNFPNMQNSYNTIGYRLGYGLNKTLCGTEKGQEMETGRIWQRFKKTRFCGYLGEEVGYL